MSDRDYLMRTPLQAWGTVNLAEGDAVMCKYGQGRVVSYEVNSCYPWRIRLDADGRLVGCFYSEVVPLHLHAPNKR